MNAWFTVERHEAGGWHIAATNPAQAVIVAEGLSHEDAMTLATMVASKLRLNVRTRIEETP